MTQVYTEKDLQQALQAVQSGTSQTRAADDHGIPRQTLNTRLKKPSSTSMSLAKEKRQRLPRDREREVCDWALASACGSKPKPRTYLEIMDHVSEILEQGGDNEPLGKNWINGFIRRYPVIKIIKTRRPKRAKPGRKVNPPKSGTDNGQVTAACKSPINSHDDAAMAPAQPEVRLRETHSKCDAEAPDDGRHETRDGSSGDSNSKVIAGAFWEPIKPSPESLKSFKEALRARAKGLPRQIPGVRLLTRHELRTRGKSPPLTIVHTESNNEGGKVPSIHHMHSPSSELADLDTVMDKMLAEDQGARSRIRDDPGHTTLEWHECQNMRIYLIEQALDSQRSPQWVFWKSRDTEGRITGDWKPNSVIETQQLGQIAGKSWFYCPLTPVLNLRSAFFIYNQIKFRGDSDVDKLNNILPIIFVTSYAGPNPEKIWKRYISSYNGQAHVQFHARYLTSNPPSTIMQSIKSERGEGFGFRRESYTLGGLGESGASVREGRISTALMTRMDPQSLHRSLYSAVTLADSGTFHKDAPGKLWDKEFTPCNCGQFTGIAVFQSMIQRVIHLCKDENAKTIKAIPQRSTWLDEESDEETERLINAVCDIIDQTTKGIKGLAKDCQMATQAIVDRSGDHEAEYYNCIIKERWDRLVDGQQEIYEELASMILNLYED